MDGQTEIECPKCHEGSLTCVHKTHGFSYETEWGTEWDYEEWVELLSQSCECVFSHEEHIEISNMTINKLEQLFRENVTVLDSFEDGDDGV